MFPSHLDLWSSRARGPQSRMLTSRSGARVVRICLRVAGSLLLSSSTLAAGPAYQIFVSNEKSGDVTVLSGGDFKVVSTIPVGKRPRGIHVTSDGKTVYVAVSGTPRYGSRLRSMPRAIRSSRKRRKATTMMTMMMSRRIRPPTVSPSWTLP